MKNFISASTQKYVAIYSRVASLDTGALDAQEELIENFIQTELNWCWPYRCQRYCDLGVSGIQLHRQGLNSIILDIEHGKIACVVVSESDRLFCCKKKMEVFMQYLRMEGVDLHIVSEGKTELPHDPQHLNPLQLNPLQLNPLHPNPVHRIHAENVKCSVSIRE